MTRIAFESPDGIGLNYLDIGPRDGRPIVLLHGLAAGSAQFAEDAEHFAGLGYRVIVPDIRGHGLSGRPELVSPDSFTIARLGADMLALLDHAGVERVDWVGNSLGGIIGLRVLGEAPEKVRSFSTFGTAYRLDLPRLAATSIPLVYRLFGPGLVARIGGPGTTRNRAAQKIVSALLVDFDPQVGAAIAENVRRYDLGHHARAYTGPVLLLRGGLDRLVNLALKQTFATMEGHERFTRIDLPGGGHCANLDAREEWRAALLACWARS